jgi:tetratricopeptide (TPR) repeat protein
MHSRKRWALIATCLLVTGIASILGAWAWRQHRLDLDVEQAVASLENGGDAWGNEEFLMQVSRSGRYDGQLRLFRGAYLLRTGQAAAVLPSLAGLRAEGPLRLALLLVRSEACYKTGRLPEAEQGFLQAVSVNPQNSRGHRWLATIYHDLGNINASFAELEKVAELEPDDFYAFRLMGMLNLLDYQQNKEAAECYRKALARHPPANEVPAIRGELAQALVAMNDYTGALDVLSEVEDTAQFLAQKAECRWGLGERDEAAELLKQALALDAGERGALLLSARIALEDSKPQSAIKPLQRVLQRDPNDFNARYQLSMAYQGLGDKAAAAAELERMRTSRALLDQLSKSYFEAVQQPRDARVRDEIAELCEKLNKRELAELWRRSAEFCRQNGSIEPRGLPY